MKRKLFSLLTAFAMAAVCLVSCGNTVSESDSSKTETTTTASETTASQSTASEAAASSVSASETTGDTTAEETTTSGSTSKSDTLTTTTTSAQTRTTTTAAEASQTKASTALPSRLTTKQTTQLTTQKQPRTPQNLPYSKASALYCVDDNEYIYKHNINTRISIASTTKLLTASLAVKYLDKNKVITVGSELWFTKPYSTVAGLRIGQKLTAEQLLYGLMLPSGNDAAYTVAVNAARAADPKANLTDSQAVSAFVKMMNSFAAQLGMTSSHFANPEGWDNAMHYSTLSDMFILTRYALSQPLIAKIVSTHRKSVQLVSGEYLTWTNTNQLIDPSNAFYVSAAIGVKTGTTEDAGCCLIAAVKHAGKTYYCASMGCFQENDRYILVRKLLSGYLK